MPVAHKTIVKRVQPLRIAKDTKLVKKKYKDLSRSNPSEQSEQPEQTEQTEQPISVPGPRGLKGIKIRKAKKGKQLEKAKGNSKSSDSNYDPDNEDKYVDYGEITNEFYQRYFIQKDDKHTQKFRDIIETDFFVLNLPASFIDGLPNLQERKPIPLKTIPLFSKLIAGHYQTKFTKYDKTTVRVNIEFFTNNLPSFRKYADKDPIDWVVTEHRLLTIEIFEYYKKKNNEPTLPSIEGRFNAILRVIRIAYGNKKTPLYKLFSIMVFQLHDELMFKEGDNKLNKHEAKKYINWQDVIFIQKKLEDEFNAVEKKDTRKAYELNNDLLLISMYSLIPPLRNEVKMLEFTMSPKHNKKDYVFYDKNTIILKFNKIKKLHDKIYFEITSGKHKNPHLAKIIRQSLELYPRKFLFTLKNSYPDVSSKATQRALDERLLNIFFRNGIKNQVSVNSLRSSYASYRLTDPAITYNDRMDLVHQMRTSMLCLERSYRKVILKGPILNQLPVVKEEAQQEAQAIAKEIKKEPEEPEIVEDQYLKKQQRSREYYEKNKEKLNEYQREYNKSKKTSFERTRERMCQLLNASEEYGKKMRDSTKEKYKFVYDDASKRWKWNE
jgi:hypothetical protein